MPLIERDRGRAAGPFRAALATVLAAHALALAFPQAVLEWNVENARLWLLEGTGLMLGSVALGAFLWMVVGHVFRHVSHDEATINHGGVTSVSFSPWSIVARAGSSHLRGDDAAHGYSVADVVATTVLCIAMASGLATAALYRWASSWAAATLTPYVRSLLRFQPDVLLVVKLPLLVRLHVVCAFALLAVVPFTRVARPAMTNHAAAAPNPPVSSLS